MGNNNLYKRALPHPDNPEERRLAFDVRWMLSYEDLCRIFADVIADNYKLALPTTRSEVLNHIAAHLKQFGTSADYQRVNSTTMYDIQKRIQILFPELAGYDRYLPKPDDYDPAARMHSHTVMPKREQGKPGHRPVDIEFKPQFSLPQGKDYWNGRPEPKRRTKRDTRENTGE
jgi:hypothetical protein